MLLKYGLLDTFLNPSILINTSQSKRGIVKLYFENKIEIENVFARIRHISLRK
jgi:hypothetical protein